jgi:hypothetical protein
MAIHGATDENRQAADTIATFRDSLPKPRWRLLFTIFAAIAILLVQPALELMTGLVSKVFLHVAGPGSTAWLEEPQKIFGELTSYVASLSLDRLGSLFQQILAANLKATALLLATIAAVLYLVLRPLSTSFRIKRMLFNISGSDIPVSRSFASWHPSRQVGLYSQEGAIFDAYGSTPPREWPFDLLISGGATVLCTVAVGAALPPDLPWVVHLLLLADIIALGCARFGWLVLTWRQRENWPSGRAKPGTWILPASGGLVEARSILGTTTLYAAGLSPFVWYRLNREAWLLRREEKALQAQPDNRRHWLAPMLTSIFAGAPVLVLISINLPSVPIFSDVLDTSMILLGPILLPASFVLQFALLDQIQSKYPSRTVILSGIACAFVSAAFMSAFSASAIFDYGWESAVIPALSIHASLLAAAAAVTLIQNCQNKIIGEIALPLPLGSPEGFVRPPLGFRRPPNWPPRPPGWSPPANWQPDRQEGSAPKGWHFWAVTKSQNWTVSPDRSHDH